MISVICLYQHSLLSICSPGCLNPSPQPKPKPKITSARRLGLKVSATCWPQSHIHFSNFVCSSRDRGMFFLFVFLYCNSNKGHLFATFVRFYIHTKSDQCFTLTWLQWTCHREDEAAEYSNGNADSREAGQREGEGASAEWKNSSHQSFRPVSTGITGTIK